LKDENGDLLADSHNILNRWKNYFPRLLNVLNISSQKIELFITSAVRILIPARVGSSRKKEC
jgi:hypothetical protein